MVLIAVVFFLLLFGCTQVSIEEMKVCEVDEDCVQVGCECQGLGDVINKKYISIWVAQNNPNGILDCPTVVCPPSKISCEENNCVSKTNIENMDYNKIEAQRVLEIINSLKWVGLGKYMPGEEDVSNDIFVNGNIKIDVNDINHPCIDYQCRFAGFEINLPTSYVGNEEYVSIDSNNSLIVKNATIRFSKIIYDTHPGPSNFTYIIRVYPSSNTYCQNYLCEKNNVCYSTYYEQCMACGSMNQESCVCSNEDGNLPNLTECTLWGSGDLLIGGYCIKGSCDYSNCILDCNSIAGSNKKCYEVAQKDYCKELFYGTEITQNDIYKITKCRNGKFCERNNICYENEIDYELFCEQVYKKEQCNDSGLCVPSCFEEVIQKPQHSGSEAIITTGKCYGLNAYEKNHLDSCYNILDYYDYEVDYGNQDPYKNLIIDLKDSFANYCVFYGSQYLNDESLCEQIEDADGKRECYVGLAFRNSDFSYCEKAIIPESENPVAQNAHDRCIDNVVYLKIEEGTYNINMCEQYIEEYNRDYCIRNNPTAVEDCDKLQSESSKGFCIKNVGKRIGNKSYCKLLSDGLFRLECG